MTKINNEFLKNYLSLDREIKHKTKDLNQMKKQITNELNARKGKAIITRLYIVSFELLTRAVYTIPNEIKQKYRTDKEYKILKVTEKKI